MYHFPLEIVWNNTNTHLCYLIHQNWNFLLWSCLKTEVKPTCATVLSENVWWETINADHTTVGSNSAWFKNIKSNETQQGFILKTEDKKNASQKNKKKKYLHHLAICSSHPEDGINNIHSTCICLWPQGFIYCSTH